MAIIKTPNTTGKYHDLNSYSDIINYITRPDKAITGYTDCIWLDPYNPAGSMEAIAKKFHQEKGVHVRHFILAFEPEECVRPETANLIGLGIINYLGEQYQAIYAVHEDEPQLHIHIVMNAVSFVDGHKYRGTREVFYEFINVVSGILGNYGLLELQYVSNKPRPNAY